MGLFKDELTSFSERMKKKEKGWKYNAVAKKK